jgi:glycerol-1-phosphate dehydrogenase [NAD(P)+]
MDVNSLLNRKIKCNCGKEHHVTIANITIKKDALNDIPRILESLNIGKRIHLVADKNTYEIAGAGIERLVRVRYDVTKTVFQEDNLTTDLNSIEHVMHEMPSGTSCIVAVGSGTINDISRYVSFKSGIPYVIAATAPSMDGYASAVSPMIVDGIKLTREASPAIAIIADTGILAASPYNMILAGFGDIIGKINSLADWKLGALLTGEYYCPFIVSLVRESLEICISSIDGLKQRDPKAIEALTNALIISGIAMLFAGKSRPASGAEHHLSHFWEMYFLQKGGRQPLHGEKVGIATVIMTDLYNRLAADGIKTSRFDNDNPDEIKAGIKAAYGKQADRIIEENFGGKKVTIDHAKITGCKDEIIKIASEVPDCRVVRGYLEKLGAYFLPEQLGIDDELKRQGIKYCMYLRNLVTILRLYRITGKDFFQT